MNNRLGTILSMCFIGILFAGGVVSNAIAKGQQTTKSIVYDAPNFVLGDPIEGALSKVVRTTAGISLQLRTNGLMPGEAFTLLVAVYNDPDNNCGEPNDYGYRCTSADLFDLDLQNQELINDVLFVTGHVVGKSGRGSFAGHLPIFDNSISILQPALPIVAPPLAEAGFVTPGVSNPEGAELHILLFSHQQKLFEYMPSMINSFAGGCTVPPVPFDWVHLSFIPEWGEVGTNYCELRQEAFNLAQ